MTTNFRVASFGSNVKWGPIIFVFRVDTSSLHDQVLNDTKATVVRGNVEGSPVVNVVKLFSFVTDDEA